MASGSFEGVTSSQYCISKIEWSSTPDTSKNTSTVTAKLYLKRTNDHTTYGNDWSLDIFINGTQTTVTPGLKEVGLSWLLMATATTTVAHNADGTKSITISAGGGCSGTSVKSITCSQTVKLDTIHRASTITSAGNVTLGNSCSVIWTPASASFSYKLMFSIGGWDKTTGVIKPNTTNAYTYTGYTIPLTVADQITTSKTGTMKVTLYSYSDSNGSNQIGTAGKTFTVTVPQSCAPEIKSITITPVSSYPVSQTDSWWAEVYIQGYSKAKVTVSDSSQYGATTSYKTTVAGIPYTGSSFTSFILNTYGNISVTVTVTDSRGYTTTKTETINVLAYSKPEVKSAEVYRSNESGVADDGGTYITIGAARSYTSLMNGTTNMNGCRLEYRYKENGGTWGEWKSFLVEGASADYWRNAISGFSVDKIYTVQVSAVDTLGNRAISEFTIPTDKVYWHRDGAQRAFAFGEYVQNANTFAIASDIEFQPKGGTGMIGTCDYKDLNEFSTKSGYYYVNGISSDYDDKNYPDVFPGMLEVKVCGSYVWQTYRTRTNAIYARAYALGSWTAWKKII